MKSIVEPWTSGGLPRGTWLTTWDDASGKISFKLIRQLDDVEAQSLLSDFQSLRRMDTNLFFDGMLDNFREWHGLTTLLDTRRHQPYVERVGPDHKALVRRFLVTLTTALTSASAYLESREAQLADQFGPSSEQVESFRSLKSAAFDSHFSYRLCGKLRNFSHTPHLWTPSPSLKQRISMAG